MRKSNFGWHRDPNQTGELELIVFLECTAEEFEFPVRAAADVEHAIRPAPLIDDNQAAVVGERLLAVRRTVAGDLFGFLLIGGCERMNLIKILAFPLRAKLESKRERLVVARGEHLLALYFLAVFIGDDGDDGLARKPDSAEHRPG